MLKLKYDLNVLNTRAPSIVSQIRVVSPEEPMSDLHRDLLAFDALLDFIGDRPVDEIIEKLQQMNDARFTRFIKWPDEIRTSVLDFILTGDDRVLNVERFIARLRGITTLIDDGDADRIIVDAARYGALGIVRMIPDQMVSEIDEALQAAAEYGHLNVVRFLLDERNGERANIHADHDAALRLAAQNGQLNVVRFLLDERNGERATIHALRDYALRWAAENGHLNVVRFLLDERNGQRADIHADDDDALRSAARNGKLNVVRFLLDERNGVRADVTALDDLTNELPSSVRQYLDDRQAAVNKRRKTRAKRHQ